jgi:general stress protein CsbA
MKSFMKIFNIFFCLVFILFAALQYNDPDPYIWMPIYLYTAVLCVLAARKQFHRGAYLIGILVYLIYATYLFFDRYGVMDWAVNHHAENIAQTMKATKPWIEETREFFGLFILIIVLLVNYTYASQRIEKKTRKKMMKIKTR